MAFSAMIEGLNMMVRRVRHKRLAAEAQAAEVKPQQA
jgi:hypothetical protein